MKSPKPLSGIVCCLGLVFTAGAQAEECADLGATENFNAIRYCVSSVLAPQGSNSYGPANLFDADRRTAWCEGARGSGAGQVITLEIDGGGPFRRFLIENGYGKDDRIFSRNARPRTIQVTTDTGLSFRHQLEDRWNERWVDLPAPGEYRSLQIKVLDVYPGSRYEDMCISTILVDFDYEKFLEWQGDEPGRRQEPAMPDAPGESGAQGKGTPVLPDFEELPPLPEL